MTDYRVLITGSRDWPYPGAVHDFLNYQYGDAISGDWTRMVVVHGDAQGADRAAGNWVRNFTKNTIIPVVEEPHPADWSLGRGAGLLRNQDMVSLGADVCGAFRYRMSRGTTDCMNRAAGAGIPVALFDEVEEE